MLRTQSLRKRKSVVVALAKSKGLGVAKHNHCEGANTMIMERGARPDAIPKPKRRKTVLVVVLAVGIGLALALGLGVGLGPGIKRYLSTLTPHPSLCCTGQHVGQSNAQAQPR